MQELGRGKRARGRTLNRQKKAAPPFKRLGRPPGWDGLAPFTHVEHRLRDTLPFIIFGTLLDKPSSELLGDFPGGPVAKTPHSQYRGPGFDPWSRN